MVDGSVPTRTALVSGCAGFLGSHLTDRLLADGRTVIGLDNLMCGSLRNLREAESTGRFAFHEHDVIDPFDAKADLVLNLACPASPPRYQVDPIHTLKTSIMGTLNMAEIALRSGARIMHTSTSEVYGDPEIHPQVEGYRGSVNPHGPRACYDEGKRASETILFDLHRTQGLDVAVSRLFNTYGPRMDPYDGRVVSNFMRQALMGEPLTIYGDGLQTRSFCYADDTVEALWRLSLADKDVTGPINIGNPGEMTMLELAETIRELVGKDVQLVFKPLPTDDPTRREPDISKAKAELAWEPKISLAEGLQRTIDYFDDIITSGAINEYSPLAEKTAAE